MSETKYISPRRKWVGYRKPNPALIPSDWQAVRVRDVATFRAGGSLGLTMSDYKESGTPAFTAEGQNGFVSVTEHNAKAVIVSSIGALCGKCFYADGPFTTLANVQIVFGDEAKISNYLLWSILNDRAFWAPYQTAQPFIRPSDIQKSWIPLPPPAEQTRIAETLKAADDHIRALEDQIRKAERVKKALLQEVFGNLIHSRHLKGRECFTAHGSSGFDEHVHVADTPNEGIPYFKVDDFNSPGNERYLQQASTSVVVTPESKCVPYAAGGVVFAKRGAALTKNRVRINATPCFIDPNLMLLRPVPGVVESEFLRYYLMHFRLEKLGEDAGIPQLNNKDLYPKLFPVPDDKAIRENIVKKLNAAEGLVDACNAQLAAARRVKQSLLQNLLAGRIRLKV